MRRFAAAIGEFSGRLDDPMSPEHLLTLQKAVLGPHALRVGVRQSPVFVGQSSFRAQLVHYIAPGEDMVPGMLDALRLTERRTRGANSVARAADIVLMCVLDTVAVENSVFGPGGLAEGAAPGSQAATQPRRRQPERAPCWGAAASGAGEGLSCSAMRIRS